MSTEDPEPRYIPPPPTPTPPTTSAVNPLAVASLILGIFPCFCLFVPGIVLGHVALRQNERDGRRGDGLAYAGLAFGYLWVVLTIYGATTGTLFDLNELNRP